MSFSKANIAGSASGRQQSEMKSILTGTWPPLKPLPVFKYETAAYRATIDFDKLRGEWVCRKTSFPSNMVQELRGGLREITMALPNGEAEMFAEGSEQAEQELEKDTNRRLQAIHDWRENSESGARYFELRGYLSESQRAETDDSLRLSLTARQLQFNAKNVAYVFDALSTAGGRFATLIEFAKRNKAKLVTAPTVQAKRTIHEAEPGIGHDNSSPEVSHCESAPVISDNIPFVRDQQATKACADEPSTLSIKNVLQEQEPSFLADRVEHTASQEFEIEAPEILDEDSASLVGQPYLEGRHSRALSDFATEARMDKSSDVSTGGSSSRLRRLEISAFQVTAFALLFLFTVAALTIGLTPGRGSLVRQLLGASKATSAMNATSLTPPRQADEPASRTPTPLPASSNEPTRASKLDSGAKTIESKVTANPEVTSEQGAAIGPIVSNVSPPAISIAAPSPKAVVPRSSAMRKPTPYGETRTAGTPPYLSRPSTILVNVPIRGSRPFRVSFPEKAVAATTSLAITSQLSILLIPALHPIEADKPARLEAGQLVSLALPHYPKQGDRYGGAEVIRVRATIGPLGQVRDVKFLSGSISLLPATIRAIRQWRYRPTLLDKRPIQAQQDLTIEFRPSQYSSQAPEFHATQKLDAVK
jgi:periplasmic protein TonB